MEKKIQDGTVDPNAVNKEKEGQDGKEQPTPPTKVEDKKEGTKTETKTESKEQPKEIKKEEKDVTYKDAIVKVTAKYEKKLEDQKLTYEKKIKERDDVIAEMLVNEDNGKTITPKTSIHDVIMKRRAYNKW